MITNRHPDKSNRRGFTLLELMVVIGIIALLAAISFTVIGGALDSANRAATLTTIAKVDKLYRQHLRAFYAHYDPRHPETKRLARDFGPGGHYAITNGVDRTGEDAIAIAQKALLIGAFPQHSLEVYGFTHQANNTIRTKAFADWAASNTVSNADSIELLYLALTQGSVRGAPAVDDSAFSGSELGDTDGDGHIEILDAWGNPLRFYRWATRLINPLGFRGGRLSQPMTDSADQLFYEPVPGADFPDPDPPYHVIVGGEQMLVNGKSSGVLTVERGQRNTQAAGHAMGDLVKIAPFTEVASLLLGSPSSDLWSKDPDDKFGSIRELDTNAAPRHLYDLNSAPFPGYEVQDYELLFHTFDSYNPPLIVSAGWDGELGLVEPGPTGSGGTEEPRNIWAPNMSTVQDPWRWGTLAQPLCPPDPSSPSGRDFSILTNPGSSVLADNLANYVEGLGN